VVVPRGKREPSSPTKITSSIGRRVTTFARAIASIAASPPATPSGPSSRPPDGTLSRCEPVHTGAASGSAPARRARRFPTSSCRTVRPAARHRSIM
jgi:hypothetical protein